MKKMIMLLTVLLALCVGAAGAQAGQRYVEGDWVFTLLEDGTAEIADYKGEARTLNIPSRLSGYPVSSIGYNAIASIQSARKAVIPEGVLVIGESAFYNCKSLETIEIPESVLYFGDGAFTFCESFTTFTVPDTVIGMGNNPFSGCYGMERMIVAPSHPVFAEIDGVLFEKANKRLVSYPLAKKGSKYVVPDGIAVIGAEAFSFCELKSVELPDSVTAIEDGGFFSCGELKEIVIPAGVTQIDRMAFAFCDSLSKVTLNEGVTYIGEQAFHDCDALKSIKIPDSVTTVSDNPFTDCDKLKKIEVSKKHPVLEVVDGVLFNKEEGRLICCPISVSKKTYTFPDGVRAIAGGAFYRTKLESVTIPDGVTYIGKNAFDMCSELTQAYIPASVTYIGEDAFTSWTTLTVERGSYAEAWAKENKITYTYPDADSWLTR